MTTLKYTLNFAVEIEIDPQDLKEAALTAQFTGPTTDLEMAEAQLENADNPIGSLHSLLVPGFLDVAKTALPKADDIYIRMTPVSVTEPEWP
jgi:hypothetical protein